MKVFITLASLLAVASADQHSHQSFKQGNAPAVRVATSKAHGSGVSSVSLQPSAQPSEVNQYVQEEKYASNTHAPVSPYANKQQVNSLTHGIAAHHGLGRVKTAHRIGSLHSHGLGHGLAHGLAHGHSLTHGHGLAHGLAHGAVASHGLVAGHGLTHATAHHGLAGHHGLAHAAALPHHGAAAVAYRPAPYRAAPVVAAVAPAYAPAAAHHGHALAAGHRHGHHDIDYAGPAQYTFGYAVADDYSGSNFAANEDRNDYATTGSYSVSLPDGRRQIVNYRVDDAYSGYVADVSYEGQAHYPEYVPPHVAGYKATPIHA